MEISPDIIAAHDRLGPVFRKLLDFMVANPELVHKGRSKGGFFARLMGSYYYNLQPWPVFLSGPQLKSFNEATVACTHLVKSIPERFFQNDVKKMEAYYGYGGKAFETLLGSSRPGFDQAICRLDMMFSADGIKILEVNASANLGGWNQRYAAGSQLRSPLMKRFRQQVAFEADSVDTSMAALDHVIRETLKGPGQEHAPLNLVLAVRRKIGGIPALLMNRLYRKALKKHQMTGKLLFRPYDALVARDRALFSDDKPVHAMLKLTDVDIPDSVWEAVVDGKLTYFNTIVCRYLGDKRNLALLSENVDSDIFDEKEREIIRAYIPWTRSLVNGETNREGEPLQLPDDVIARREAFVIKKGGSTQGTDVVIGKAVTDEAWREKVEHALSEGDWIVQDMVPSLTWMFYDGSKAELAPHHGVWGGFCFGDQFGGGILRVAPVSTGDDVINANRGATVVIVLETDE